MSHPEQIDSLLDRWEELRQQDREPLPEELCREAPELLDEVKARIARLKMFECVFGDTVLDDKAATIGEFCHGRYQIESLFGQGGLGSLYLARDVELDRTVIVKGIRSDRAKQAISRQQFVTEAVVTAQLEHPGIVPVYGFGCDEHQRPFYVMRMIRGRTLGDIIQEFHQKERTGLALQSVDSQRLLRHFLSVCQTIQYAHSQGIIHRDVKPANVMVGKFGEVMTVDWGLAKRAAKSDQTEDQITSHIERSAANTTRQGAVKGSPMYMSPEQAAGRTEEIGIESDVYGLGATLFELLTGQPPFTGESSDEILDRVRRGGPQSPRSLKPQTPCPLEAICMKALQHQPQDRYRTARELADELERYLADEPVLAYSETVSEMLRRWSRRHRTAVATLSAATIVALLSLIAISVVLTVYNHRLVVANRAAKVAQDQAETAEKEERKRALELERALYGNQISLAGFAWRSAQLPRLREVLAATSPNNRGLEWGFLDQQARSPEVLPYYTALPRRLRSITDIRITPNGKWLMTEVVSELSDPQASRGRHIISVDDGAIKLGLGVGFLAFSPDGSAVLRRSQIGDDAAYRLELIDFATQTPIWSSDPQQDEGYQLFVAEFFVPDATTDGVEWGKQDLIVIMTDPWADTLPGEPHYRRASFKFFSANTGQLVKTVDGDNVGNATQVTFSSDGRQVALTSSAPGPQPVPVFSTLRGSKLFNLVGHDGRINDVSFNANRDQIVTASADGSVRIWSSETGEQHALLRQSHEPVRAVAIDASGQRVASAGTVGGIRLWNVAENRLERTVAVSDDEIYAMAFSQNSSRLFAGGTEGVVYTVPAEAPPSGSVIQTDDFVARVGWASTNDRYAAVISGVASTVQAFDAAGQRLFEVGLHRPGATSTSLYVEDFAFSPDGRTLAVGGDQFVRMVDAASGESKWEVSHLEAPLAITPDGKHVIALRNRRAIIDVIEQERLFDQVQGEHARIVIENALQGGQDPFRYPDGEKQLLTLLEREPANKELVESLADQARGTFVAIDAASGKVSRVYEFPARFTNHFTMHPTKPVIAIADENAIVIFDLATGKSVSRFEGEWKSIWRLAFSPDGQRIVVVAIKGNSPVVINAADGQLVFKLVGNVQPVQQAMYTSDGRRILTCGLDGAVHVWDAETGSDLLTINASESSLYCIAVRSDGRQLLAGGGDATQSGAGELFTWEVSPTQQ